MFRIILLAWLVSMPCHAEFRDPTQPAYPVPAAAANAAADTELVLSSILISSKYRRATINGVSAKQGETIEIEPVSPVNPNPAAPENTVITGDKTTELLNKITGLTNAETNHPKPENILAPLLSAVTGDSNLTKLLNQGPMNTAASTQQQTNTDKQSKARPIPAHPIIIKIISIHKNSVTIEQNGERKTLQLVHRPYKTQ